jgi:hypothetical protein
LFFGLVPEIFGHISAIKVISHDFLREKQKVNIVLSTEKLEALICVWHAREADTTMTEKLGRLDQTIRYLRTADSFILSCLDLVEPITQSTDPKDSCSSDYPKFAAVLLAAKVLDGIELLLGRRSAVQNRTRQHQDV